jgi:hypothetical protein
MMNKIEIFFHFEFKKSKKFILGIVKFRYHSYWWNIKFASFFIGHLTSQKILKMFKSVLKSNLKVKSFHF